MKSKLVTQTLAIITALILLQTLFYKFSAAPESVYIFKTVGLEPFGRIGIGVLELIAAILLVYRKTTIYGALLSLGIISGAIFLHLTKLGIEVMNDNGLLFYLAVTVFILSIIILLINIRKVKSVIILKKQLHN
jgi:hypothetical protein